ncbi:Trans-aconitate 2-methyltransferase [Exophiala dermatitidis]
MGRLSILNEVSVVARPANNLPRRVVQHQHRTPTPLQGQRAHVLVHPSRPFCSSNVNMSTNKDWDAAQYLKFERERTRPALDLLGQVPLTLTRPPERVFDLGCGPGNSTAVLVDRFPDAHIVGIDSSPDMLEKARKRRLPGRVEFRLGDVSDVRSLFEDKDKDEDTDASALGSTSASASASASADLLFSNAVYHWLPHEKRLEIFAEMIKTLKPGGVFAFQSPDNTSQPSHVAMRTVAEDEKGPWHQTLKRLGLLGRPRLPFQSPEEIYNSLKPLCSDINIWHTFYYHILDDHKAIVEWVKSTGLRPYIDPLDNEQREAYLNAYLERIQRLYPTLEDGRVCLPYPRLFVVAVRA